MRFESFFSVCTISAAGMEKFYFEINFASNFCITFAIPIFSLAGLNFTSFICNRFRYIICVTAASWTWTGNPVWKLCVEISWKLFHPRQHLWLSFRRSFHPFHLRTRCSLMRFKFLNIHEFNFIFCLFNTFFLHFSEISHRIKFP